MDTGELLDLLEKFKNDYDTKTIEKDNSEAGAVEELLSNS